MPAKVNCASAWANHTVGRSAQNNESRTVPMNTSAGGVFSAVSILRRGHQCGMSGPVAQRDNEASLYNKYLLLLGEEYIDEKASRQIVR